MTLFVPFLIEKICFLTSAFLFRIFTRSSSEIRILHVKIHQKIIKLYTFEKVHFSTPKVGVIRKIFKIDPRP